MRCFLVLLGIAFLHLMSAATADTRFLPKLKAGQSFSAADQTADGVGWQPAQRIKLKKHPRVCTRWEQPFVAASCSGQGWLPRRADYRWWQA